MPTINIDRNPGCLAGLLAWLGMAPKPKQAEAYFPYHVRDDFLSPAEISFYHVLQTIIGDEAVVCPKVSLGDLFYAASGDYGENRSWMNRIDRKHVDFLICNAGSLQPTLGVELDDASHSTRDRKERDEFVDQVFSAARLPLVRIPAQAQYNTDQVRQRLRDAMMTVPDERTRPPEEPEATNRAAGDAPVCPRCGAPMVLRTVNRAGPRQGEQFWGCRHFPKCRGTRDLNDSG